MTFARRITNYRKRAVIAFDVHAELVGGQDYETVLQDEPEDS
jgi:toxin ParE1/3/4